MIMVLSVESVDGLIDTFVPNPTPGSVSKKYSRPVIGPAVRDAAELMKKPLDSM